MYMLYGKSHRYVLFPCLWETHWIIQNIDNDIFLFHSQTLWFHICRDPVCRIELLYGLTSVKGHHGVGYITTTRFNVRSMAITVISCERNISRTNKKITID